MLLKTPSLVNGTFLKLLTDSVVFGPVHSKGKRCVSFDDWTKPSSVQFFCSHSHELKSVFGCLDMPLSCNEKMLW